MRSVFEIARSHITLPVSRDMNALRRVLRDWHHYTEKLELQKKTTHPAALCVTVHPSRNSTASPPQGVSLHPSLRVAAGGAYTRRVSLQLWTAVLPWEVQRGLSMSELRLSSTLMDASDSKQEAKKENENCRYAREMQEEEDDPFGVVTAPSKSANGAMRTPPCGTSAAAVTAPFPGMLFVMDVDSAAQGVSFWSGAIAQPIDVAFISPIEPAVTNSRSFQELRQRQLAAVEDGGGGGGGGVDEKRAVHNIARFFPDGELDSPTVTFALQSYSHLDPFPRCDKTGGTRRRQHLAQPAGADRRDATFAAGGDDHNNRPRYVLETTRYLIRDSVERALQECRQQRATTAGALGGKNKSVHEGNEEGMEVTITLELSDGLKEELREKARLYTNYVMPLEEHIAYHIRHQNSSVVGDGNNDDVPRWEMGAEGKTGDDHALVSKFAAASPSFCSPATPVGVTRGPIHPSRPNTTGRRSVMLLRSPKLAEEHEDVPSHLVPSVKGRHEAPVLQQVEREHGQLISAKALARYPNTSSHMPAIPPIDYELFDLCLRLGLCRQDTIYYFYGRIMRAWQKELHRLRKSCDEQNNSEIPDADVRRMFLLVRDPSLQVPEELSACVEAVARRRNIAEKA
ncbi:hypothetical protein C3747_23g102 [Trypanosoma cruzi]|uniref:Uncharacterized protein n=2 Tax=Trypanosoma cruzi TaxID=5693 RepID=Q4E1M1_TRYCC|nr:hypothetical protein, conserved [Trypanosoma cruzi]EAN98651.1 hypothetical protein, conserved [Trypanosoma cruzi]PWV16444.1 hypothetical protein C3747_23g102 [Trypanosoma cruzi]RNC47660.1 hypothetical protein TcCL_NonESM02425 [Trypanosoma cruzi]|eukprot:XP_820502.1 hypothetical protein [Trypanosoma cruzi strain CL Brener]